VEELQKREKHTMAVEEEHAMASRLLIMWRESCKRERVSRARHGCSKKNRERGPLQKG
jgi:hypothetical protein